MKSTIALLENETGCPVVQMNNRAFPGVVVQGDTLFSLYAVAERIFQSILTEKSLILDDAEFLRDSLEEYLLAYERVLQENKLMLPYPERAKRDEQSSY